jgi:type II secretory pathway predicted ATPase ExeA
MSGSPAPRDPFALTPDTGAYVPRAATEHALAELLAGVQAPGAPIALVGPAGAGKTLLLHLLAERAAPALRSVYLPNPRLGPEEICTWIARSLGAPAGEEATALLRAWLEHLRETEQACLLLVDDVDGMPEATARWLGQLLAETRGGLRLAMAAPPGPETTRRLRAIGSVRCVELEASMSFDETTEYVAWRLQRADVPESLRARFDASTVEALHRVAQGNPRRLHLAVEAFARKGNVAVLEDEIAAYADRPPEADPVAAAEPPDETPQPAHGEPAAGAPTPRRFELGPALVGVGAVLIVALLVWRDPPAPPAAPADAVGAAESGLSEPTPAGAAPSDALPVNINASPWARIEIDGVDVGETPLAGIWLRPGPHTFRAQLPDGRLVERTVEVDEANRHVVFD